MTDPDFVQTIVVQFPALAAWLIVALVLVIATGGAIATNMARTSVKNFLARMDAQDKSLGEIKELLASEVQKLRELHHDIDKRVGKLETFRDMMQADQRFGRRWEDQNHNGSAD